MLYLSIVLLVVALLAFNDRAIADTYQYDALGRLIGVVYSDGSTIAYTYDAAGNRTVVTQTSP